MLWRWESLYHLALHINLNVKPQYFEQIPIPDYSKYKQNLEEKADMIILFTKEKQQSNQKFLKPIQTEFGIEKISKKLEKFYELDFDEFVEQLKAKKMTFSPQQSWRGIRSA